MTTTGDFLRDVLPAEGWHFILTPKPSKKNPKGVWWLHQGATDTDELALIAKVNHRNQEDVYFSLASFHEESYWDESLQKRRYRTNQNADQIKAFWLDIDCGPGKDYPSQKAAGAALFASCETLGLQKPTWIVSSGNGLHVYWTLETPIAFAYWRRIATVFEVVMETADVKMDHSRTKDVSSVLRVPGTSNFKDPNNPKPVKILSASTQQPVDLSEFKSLLGQAVHDYDLVDQLESRIKRRPTKPRADSLNADLAAGIGPPPFAPCNTDKMADQCAVFREMRATSGASQKEPLWYAALGVLSRDSVVDGFEVAKAWSSGFEDFDEAEFEDKFEQAKVQFPSATTCERFKQLSNGLCEGCQLSCKSPIQLGADVQQAKVDVKGITIPPLPVGMQKDFSVDASLVVYAKYQDKADVPICNMYPSLQNIFKDGDGEHWARLHTYVRPGETPEESDIKISAISAGGIQLLSALGGRAGVVSNNANELARFMKTWYETMRRSHSLGTIFRQQGWQEDGSFLLGKDLYARDDDGEIEIRYAPVSQALAKTAEGHKPKGDLKTNIDLIDQLYNRPGMEAYQFALLASLGSPLVALGHEDWVGLPVALWSPKSGGGKTTVCKFGMSFWGDPKANGQTTYSEGATEYALYTMFGERHHLPGMVDETTNWEAKRTSSFLYQAASGLAKIQGKADGGLRDNSTRNWQSILYTTANRSLISTMLATLPNAGPMIARIFEIRVPPINLDPEDRTLIRELEKHYGLIGREFVQYIVKHREKVEKALSQTIARLQKHDTATDARFWILTAACTLLAGLIAKRLGLVQFDMPALERFIIRQLKILRATVNESNEDADSRFTRMLAELLPQTLITNTDQRPCVIDPNFPAPRHKDIIGRYLTDSRTLYLTVKAIRRWCAAAGEDYLVFRDAAKELPFVKSMDASYRLTTGTRVGSMGVQRCWQIEMPDDVEERVINKAENNVRQLDDYR